MTVAEATGSSPETLGGALERAALDPSAGVRLLDRRETDLWIPWSEVLAAAAEIAGGLAAAGVRRGERVGLIGGNGRELVEGFFGAALAGAVPASLPPPPRFGNLESYGDSADAMLAACGARMALVETRSARRLGELLKPMPLGVRTIEDLPASAGRPEEESEPDRVAMIQFSSGTALEPKPAALSHRSILGQARLLNSFWPESDVRHVGCSWLPLYHDMGLIGCLLVALERPGELVLMPPEVFAARPAIWLRAISRFGATISPATNFAYGHCLEAIRDDELDGVDLSSWRVALNGAEPISAAVMRRFAERFGRWGLRPEALTPVYGLAEASLAVTFAEVGERFSSRRFERSGLAEGDRVEERPGGRELVSVGKPVPGFALSIRDQGGATLEDGTVGRIWTRGPTLMEGYLDRETATREVLRDGWLDTGDVGFVHRGELFICGRAKDVLIVRGRNHSPVEIEQAAESVAGVRVGGATAVAHLPEDAEREQLLLLFERTRGGRLEERADLADACRAAVLARAGVDLDVVQSLPPDSLPRTSSGKVRRSEALRRYLAGELGGR